MNIRSKRSFARAPVAAFALAVSMIGMGEPAAWAQPQPTLFERLFGRHDDVVQPRSAADFFETPKSKPRVKRHKFEPAPVARSTITPSDNKATSPNTPGAKAPPAPSSGTAAVALDAAPPKASASKVNDVPVAPLE